ncbi:MAG TPA: OsmC family protein [Jiangellaceae bacterium]|nr:OsmC family protein [Jiangellaceae bacterium]
MDVVATWEGGYRCTVRARQFELVADEPPSSGGADGGPTPTELFLASVASCFTMALFYVASKDGRTLPGLRVVASGEYDGPRFRRVRVDVRPEAEIGELHALVERALAVCYVSNTLRHAPTLEVALGGDVVVSQG